MRGRSGSHLRAGELVVVRSPKEILATLDESGSRDGVPFMPEMAGLCGQYFRVSRRVEKTCVEGHWSQRRFQCNDVVFLEELRCSGAGHDGCQRGCMIFWKEAWLKRAETEDTPVLYESGDFTALRSRLKVKIDAEHYHCQSTQLSTATEYFPPRYKFRVIPQMVWVSIREIWYGNRTIMEVAGLMVHWARLSIRRWRIGDAVLDMPGPNRRTPTLQLGLKPGDRVRLKPADEIVETLDRNSKNRGMRIAVAMTQNCGNEYIVRERLDRMIDEQTGIMREVENTVSLQGLECLCYYQFGSCPRGDLQYWREIWLETCPGPSQRISRQPLQDEDDLIDVAS
jgi:hypothetical protein